MLKNIISLCSDTDADSSSSLSSSSSPPLLSDDDQQDKNENNSAAAKKKSELAKKVSVFAVVKHIWVLPRKNYHHATFSKIMNMRGPQIEGYCANRGILFL